MRIFKAFMLAYMCVALAGCSDLPYPKSNDILKGGNTVRVGMAMSQVRALYGDPVSRRTVVSKEWGESREEWFYRSTLSPLPANAGYLSEDTYLYFDGETLTNISYTPIGKSEENVAKEMQ